MKSSQMPTLSQNDASPSAEVESVPLLDVSRQNGPLHDEAMAAIDRVCRSGRFVGGPDCGQLETEIAEYCQTRHAIGCASGSDALLLALMAFDIAHGDEVILPSYTFFATAGAVWRVGAKPVFVDIDPLTYNLDPSLIEAALTPRTKAILPVHLYGQCADMRPILDLAQSRDIPVIEDAAQAIGSEYQGRRAGSLGDIGCFSFYPTKNLGAFGDGGMVTTNDDALAERIRLLGSHGMSPRYYHGLAGVNSRLDTIKAAVLRVKLPHLDRWTEMRSAGAHRYRKLFAAAGLEGRVQLPTVVADGRHIYNQFIIRVPGSQRDALRSHLSENQIGSEIYYPVPVHRQKCFHTLGIAEGSLPHTEQAARETLALPIFSELTAAEQQRVVDVIADFYAQQSIRPLTKSA